MNPPAPPVDCPPAAAHKAGHRAGPGCAAALAALFLLSCSGGRDRSAPADPGALAQTGTNVEHVPLDDHRDGSAIDAGAPLAEAVARDLLTRRFRAAGFRVRNDVRIRQPGPPALDVTVDGYDPDAQVGYEYIDASEASGDLAAGERDALDHAGTPRILVLDAGPRDAVIAAADEFLRRQARHRN